MNPIDGGKITTAFGVKGKMWTSGQHEGVDIACKDGTPVHAMTDGVVRGVGIWGKAFGIFSPVIKHGQSYVVYAHLSRVAVKTGQRVKRGQVIGYSGHNGNATGPHLHVEEQAHVVWTAGGGLNPQHLLDA